jgi:hypothetical protein
MTSRYRGPDRAKLRVQRVREAWVQLAAVIREEQANPLYCGQIRAKSKPLATGRPPR